MRNQIRIGLSALATSVSLAVAPAVAETPTFQMTTDIPPAISTPNEVDTSLGTLKFFDGVPTDGTVTSVYDYVDRARAVDVYIDTIPIVSMEALRAGGVAVGSDAPHKFLMAEDLLTGKPLVLTANTSTLYTWSFLDLERDGPTVIELPQGMLGALNDAYFRYLADLGVAGQDQGKGGKYLVLPPGYDGDVPDGYFVVKSDTNAVWVFMRGYLKDGLEAAVSNVKDNLNAYPLSKADAPPVAEFINVSEMAEYQTIPPNDISFYEMLNDVVQREPIAFIAPETRGRIAEIGIVKGKDFLPDERMKALLTDAVAIGNAYARANTVYPRDPGNRIYGPDSEWVMGFADKNTTFLTNGALNADARLWMHYNAIVVTPAMAVTKPGVGSDYGIAGMAKGATVLDGAKTYKLTIPKGPPAKDFWAVTLYDTQTRSIIQTDQKFPTLGSQTDGVKKNDDGSYDIYFAPKAPDGMESNWLQTIPGKSWFIILRMYGPQQAWIDKTWRPGEIELVE
ncbi:MAG: DUF1254 domain-containing protein [Roseibium sp.]|uniref:DUF1254 domain-containing protein n=1 Tax=Roseibium sp. TaxID=1936156 RepID=UPI003D9C5008